MILLGTISTLMGIHPGLAQPADPAAPPESGPPSVNKRLAPKLEELAKTALRVDHEAEGVIYIAVDKQSYARDTEILFVRPRGSRVEMVATGKVGLEQKIDGKKFLLIQLNRESVVKYPKAGDYAVTMSDPTAPYAEDKKDNSNFLKPEDNDANKKPRDPGYLEFGLGLARGNLKTTTSDQDPLGYPTNGAKNPASYSFRYLHFAYFSDFVPLGIEYNGHSGVYPTSTYFAKTVKTETSVSTIDLYYRFRKFWNNRIRIAPKLSFLTDSFKTDNDDKSLLTSNMSGLGVGLRASLDLQEDNWKPNKGQWFFTLQKIYGEYTQYLSVTAKDDGVSRGTESAGSTGSQYKIGGTILLYFDFIPVVKRFVLDGGYAQRSYSLKFQGKPTQDQAGGTAIPTGLSATEKDGYTYFFFGIRFEDPLFLLKQTKYEKVNK